MPGWFTIYLSIFCLMVVVNCIVLIRSGSKILLIAYEIVETLLLVYLAVSYWSPELQKFHGIWIIPAYTAVIGIDFYISIWGNLKDLGINLPEEIEEENQEAATALSLMLSAPMYIIGGLVCLNYIFPH